MRALLPTTTACLLLSSLAAGFAGALPPQSDAPAGTPAAPAATPSAATPSAAAPPAAAPPAVAAATSGTAADNDAAAKHAKRTACLKNAKAKKLVGPQKTAFIKECVGAP